MTRCLNGHDVNQYTFPWCTLLLRRGLRTLSGVGTCSRASRQSNSSSFCDRSLAPLERWPSLIGVVLFCLYPPPPQAPPRKVSVTRGFMSIFLWPTTAPAPPLLLLRSGKYALHEVQVDLRGRCKVDPAVEVKAFLRDESSWSPFPFFLNACWNVMIGYMGVARFQGL